MQFKKSPIQKQVLKIYNDEFACFRVGDNKHLKIYIHALTHTHTYIHTQGDVGQVASLSCTLIQPG